MTPEDTLEKRDKSRSNWTPSHKYLKEWGPIYRERKQRID
jgi:hypothetical protein